MTDLPFVTQPLKAKKRKVGSKSTGILSVPIYGSLTVGEVATVSELCQQGDNALVISAKLADRIHVEEGISILEAHSIVTDAALGRELGEEKSAITLRYFGEIMDLTKVYVNAGRERQLASVTALIRHRLDRPEWQIDDTGKIPQPLMVSLYDLFEEERDAGSGESGAPPNEEDLKKEPLEIGKNTE